MTRYTLDHPLVSPRTTRKASKCEDSVAQQSPSSFSRKRLSRDLKTEDSTDLTRPSRSIRIFHLEKEETSSDVPTTSGAHATKIVSMTKVKKEKKEIKKEEKDTLKNLDEEKSKESRPLGLKRLTREMQKEKDRRAFKAMGSQLKGSSINWSVIPSDRREGLMKFMEERKEKKEEKKIPVEQKENTRIEEKIAGSGHSNRFSIKDAPDWVKKVVVKNKKKDEVEEKTTRNWDHVFAPDHNFLDVEIVPDGVKRARKGMN